ncbi:UDP-N-acetylmuramoyl-L-alanyl-D-glutamate--2,6-diaminopimelate ligase [Pelagibacteraceae bacterium]|nr:UDP-N-acetylmuramoyl-L-alanyl-D-glutamate--2,6-diaminopimelate ligase [Pelagibacteraceae bacterium]
MKNLLINMLLKNLINITPKDKGNIQIKGLSTNSKEVKKNFIFFAIKGKKINGEKFINQAINNGASVIVCEKSCKFKSKKILIFKKKNIRYFVSKIASKFYKLKPKNIIAVTGTNGKTSVSDLFYQILTLNKISAASIGTLGVKYKNKIIKTRLTSPDTISIHRYLHFLKNKKIDNVIIEASSHGLDQKRLHHINFKSAIFTNFSQDHLDYHKTMVKYLNAKLILFQKILSHKGNIIADKTIKQFLILKSISKKRKLNLVEIDKILEKIENIFSDKYNTFQKKNLAMAIAASNICGLKNKKIYKTLKKINDVSGRLELVRTLPNNVKIFIDYAHTPDALLKTIQSLKKTYEKKITLVFGCGGDRDKKKRPLMAKIANSNCEKIFITDDNPRNESPEKIRNEIFKNINIKKCFNISNREHAIRIAIMEAEPNEIILVAGKGHETQQFYKNKIIPFSDKKVIKKTRLSKKLLLKKNQNYLFNTFILKKIKKNNELNELKSFEGLAIDSRMLKKNNLFLTLRGKKNNGIQYIPNAIKKGAKYIVSSKNIKNYKKKLIKVENEIKFLKNFAELKRAYTAAKIIAITGSAGKTSLKNLTKDLLQNFGKTHFSPKSYNNHFGVPISLSNLSIDDQYGVFEVGMSKAGEINNLSKLIQPHIGIITNVGEAHIENFNNITSIAKAKGEIIDNIKENGTIILNRDDKFFRYFLKKAKLKNIKTFSFGKNYKSDIYPINMTKNNNLIKMTVKTKDSFIDLQIKNINFYNVLASLAILKVLNLNLSTISKFFKNYEPTEGRGRIHDIKRYSKKFKLIDESYNANPLSVRNAINNFSSIKKKKLKKYLILGDMLELGRKSEMYHKDLSKVINSSDIDKVFITGQKTLFTFKNLNKSKRGNIFQNVDDIDLTLKSVISNNDYLMIKGSNATGLNILSKKMIKGV